MRGICRLQKRWLLLGQSIGLVLAGMLVVGLLLAAGEGVLAQEPGWSTPVMISTNTVNSWWSDVAVDAFGQPHVVWYSSRSPGEYLMDLLMYSTLADQEWLEPNDVALTAYGGYTVRPAIAADNTTALHMTFRGQTTIYYTNASVSNGWSAGSWTRRRRISGAGSGSAYYTDIAVDESGRIHVVWNEDVSDELGETWLWFGTVEGGAAYDGETWQPEETTAGLGNRQVRAIFEDSVGVQWFGTDEGMYRYDGITWQTLTVQDGLVAQGVNCIAQDEDDKLWFGTDWGVSVYNEAAWLDKWTTYTVGVGLPDNTVYAIARDNFRRLWLGTANGLASYDGQHWVSYTPQDGLVAAEIPALAVDTQGHIWAGSEEGLSRYDGKQWTTYTVENGLLSNVVTALAADQEGAIWVGTDSGLSHFNGQEWTSYTSGEGLPGGAVTTLMVDSGGVIWVGTDTGVSSYDGRTWEPFELPQGLASETITVIGEDSQLNGMCPSCADVFYRYSTNGGRSWSAPVNLSRSFAGSVKPQVRTGSGGDVYVVWEEGEDWYHYSGYPIASMYIHSPDGGNTWDEPTVFTSTLGAPQQITLGVGPAGNVVVVWRLPEEESSYYFQLSADNGASWSDPVMLPGVIAKPWAPFSLDACDAATDSAGNVHLLVLGRLFSLEEDLGVIHLVWNGSQWSAPIRVFASSDPPEWPRISVGAGNQVHATWFTRDEPHIENPDRGRYKIWVSSYQASAPPQPPSSTPVPTRTPVPTEPGQQPASSTTATPYVDPHTSGAPTGLYTETDEVSRLAAALLPTVVILAVILALRVGRSRRPR